MTPLHSTARGGHEAVVYLLLDWEAGKGARNYCQWTLLRCAAWGGHEATVRILLDRGASRHVPAPLLFSPTRFSSPGCPPPSGPPNEPVNMGRQMDLNSISWSPMDPNPQEDVINWLKQLNLKTGARGRAKGGLGEGEN